MKKKEKLKKIKIKEREIGGQREVEREERGGTILTKIIQNQSLQCTSRVRGGAKNILLQILTTGSSAFKWITNGS